MESQAVKQEEKTKTANGKKKAIIAITVVVVMAAIVLGAFAAYNAYEKKYYGNVDASRDIVWFDRKNADYCVDLKNGKTQAIKHSDENHPLIKELIGYGFENIVIPQVLLTDQYTYKTENRSESFGSLYIHIDFYNTEDNSKIDMGITSCEGEPENQIGLFEIVPSLYNFKQLKQLTCNGTDIILMIAAPDNDYIDIRATYIDNFYCYDVSSLDITLDKTIEIIKTLENN